MRATNLHLNLLRPEEKTSSSPVRLRVMLPILSLLLCAACAIWWGVLFMQGLLLNGKVTSVRADLEGKKTAHAAILAKMADMRERQSQLDQLAAYKRGCHKYGGLMAKLAEVVPAEVQLTALTIPEPPPQLLTDPKNPKRPPLLGPTNTTESVQFRISGRTAATASVTAFMEAVESDMFSEWIVVDKDKKNAAARKKKRIHIRQESRAGDDGVRMLAFDVEFRCKERRFEK
jgi:Tfp pilus assembly protein PilN